MGVTPNECAAIPGVYYVCLNNNCFPITDFTVKQSLYVQGFDTNEDCRMDAKDFDENPLEVAKAYVDVMGEYALDGSKWRLLGKEGFFNYTVWASSVREAFKAIDNLSDRSLENGSHLVASRAANSGRVVHYSSYDATTWNDVVVPEVGLEGDVIKNLVDTACIYYKDLFNGYLDKIGKSHDPDFYEDEDVKREFLIDLPDSLRTEAKLNLARLSQLAEGGLITLECKGDGCPEDGVISIDFECQE